jgi:hypothetical protein
MRSEFLAAAIALACLVAVPRIAGAADEGQLAEINLPLGLQSQLERALDTAGENAPELVAALAAAPEEQRKALAYLIAYMPATDLAVVKGDFLLEDVALAFQARGEVPWGDDIPEEIFFDAVLPYANLNERRDDWRADFHRRFLPVARPCSTAAQAAMRLNETVFSDLDVAYHATKRPKPDESPYESIEAKYASCTGLSILLVDACRAVGVPARVVGTPSWTTVEGNHNWVEIWDGTWRFLGAAEPGPLDETWFVERAREADERDPEHRIYAATWGEGDTSFPLVWDRSIDWVRAVDVTPFYTRRQPVTFRLLSRMDGNSVSGRFSLRLKGRLVAEGDVVGRVTWPVATGETYEMRVAGPKNTVARGRLQVPEGESPTVTLRVDVPSE